MWPTQHITSETTNNVSIFSNLSAVGILQFPDDKICFSNVEQNYVQMLSINGKWSNSCTIQALDRCFLQKKTYYWEKNDFGGANQTSRLVTAAKTILMHTKKELPHWKAIGQIKLTSSCAIKTESRSRASRGERCYFLCVFGHNRILHEADVCGTKSRSYSESCRSSETLSTVIWTGKGGQSSASTLITSIFGEIERSSRFSSLGWSSSRWSSVRWSSQRLFSLRLSNSKGSFLWRFSLLLPPEKTEKPLNEPVKLSVRLELRLALPYVPSSSSGL